MDFYRVGQKLENDYIWASINLWLKGVDCVNSLRTLSGESVKLAH